jgi:hypothetical protein
MMKYVNSLIAACFCTLAFASSTAAGELKAGAQAVSDRLSWSELMSYRWGGPVGDNHSPVQIIEVDVDPSATEVPGAIAAVMPEYEAVLSSIRAAVARDGLLSSSLKNRGYDVDDVLGLRRGKEGVVELFVSSDA